MTYPWLFWGGFMARVEVGSVGGVCGCVYTLVWAIGVWCFSCGPGSVAQVASVQPLATDVALVLGVSQEAFMPKLRPTSALSQPMLVAGSSGPLASWWRGVQLIELCPVRWHANEHCVCFAIAPLGQRHTGGLSEVCAGGWAGILVTSSPGPARHRRPQRSAMAFGGNVRLPRVHSVVLQPEVADLCRHRCGPIGEAGPRVPSWLRFLRRHLEACADAATGLGHEPVELLAAGPFGDSTLRFPSLALGPISLCRGPGAIVAVVRGVR